MLDYFTEPEEPRWTRWLLLAFIPLLALYFIAAKSNGEYKNHDVYENDQKVYLNTAKKIAEDRSGYFTPRQRTPGYPYFLSLFYSAEKFEAPVGSKPPFAAGWFERGVMVNIVLSMFLLAGLFLFCRRWLPRVESGIIACASGFLLFTFKAGYVQPEISYWVLNTALFVLLGRMLVAPSWWLAALCGGLSALAYFVKAGTQPLLLLFAVSWGLKLAWDGGRHWLSRRRGDAVVDDRKPRLAVMAAQGGLVIVLYFVLLAPYLAGTAKKFGSPFYSVYSEYLMWLPMNAEGEGDPYLVDRDHMWGFYHSGARDELITLEDFNAGLERAVRERLQKKAKAKGWSEEELEERVARQFEPVDELASAGGYFERYGLGFAGERVKNGFRMVGKRINKYYQRAAEMIDFTKKLILVGLALRLFLFLRGGRERPLGGLRFEEKHGGVRLGEVLSRHPYLPLYAIGFFVGYGVLYAWYDALGIGPRLMLSLYVPLLFVAVWGFAQVYRPLVWVGAFRGKSVYLGKVANVLLLGMLVYGTIKLMTGELYEHLNTGG